MQSLRRNFLFPLLFVLALPLPCMALELVLTAGGDTNFAQSVLSVAPSVVQKNQAKKYDRWYQWSELTRHLTPELIDGDLNFLNLETVVTDDIQSIQVRQGPHFAFASHINGVRHLASLGFNLFSLANNHAYDFGDLGLLETLDSLHQVKEDYPTVEFNGLEMANTYGRPQVFDVKGLRVAFAAINGVGGRQPKPATEGLPSMMTIRNSKDYKMLIQNFRDVEADLKILSVHNGAEGHTEIEEEQVENFHYAVDRGDVDIIIGHHPHVVRPVETYKGSVILYSLGNFLMLGAANIDKKSTAKSFGALSKIYLEFEQGEMSLKALKLVPLRKVHVQPRPLFGEESESLIRKLNQITRNRLPQTGVQFETSAEGQGLYCLNPSPGTRGYDMCREESRGPTGLP